ncbi:MAG: glycosyl hydrolase [Verrucomicrobiia bacterium]
MKRTTLLFLAAALAVTFASNNPQVTAADADALARGFAKPPDSARPWVYWFPLDGNISSNGITADLEAMKRVGIGGVLYMETDQGAPKGPAQFAGPLWRDLFKHICNETHRLGLQVNMNNDAGWCGSGGPWITPELSMQRIVWTETNVVGAQRFDGVLPQPKANKDFYRDIAVFAYPTTATNYTIPHIRGKSAETREEVPLRTTFPAPTADTVVPRERIVNLTAKLGKDGWLAWDVPVGKWTLLRVGHTTTGKDNHPAPLEGRGLECDKLSKEAAEVQFNNLMGKLIADNKPLVGERRALVSTHIDSWEVGSQNWTPKFREEFQRLRGYDPMPLLPVMSGRVVDSAEVSERFLWDVRQTVNDLLCENYAGHFHTLAHRHGIRLSIEAYDTPPCDDLTYAGRADEPMAEFWSWGIGDSPWFAAYSCTEMASAAHVYGRPILGAEAFTATNLEKWQGHPAAIKHIGDWAFCEGINRFVFHRYALQPWTNPDRPPGMSMGPWGLHYERTQTWWEMSRAWHEYLSRCQFMLQQGLFVADLCFLAPESSPQRFKSPVKSGYDRTGYNFDACPPEVVLTRMSVKNGRIVLPDGMSYRMLVLPQVETMTPKLLRKIRDLVKAGATIVGAPPKKSPSLQDYPKCDEEVKALAKEVWGGFGVPASAGRDSEPPKGGTPNLECRVGKGHVIWPHEFQPKPDAAYDSVSSFGSAKWIWFPEGKPAHSAPPGTRYFRRVVNVDGVVETARLVMTADNTFECWVNGQQAGKGQNFHQGYSVNVSSLLKPGANLIAVTAVNTLDTANPAGLVGTLDIKYRDGRMQTIRTDANWEASKSAEGNWSAAMELGPLGMGPWGDIQESPEAVDTIPDIAIPSRVLAEMGVPPDFKASANIRYIHKRIAETDVYFVANPEPNEVEARCTFRVSGKQPELWWPDTGRTELVTAYEMKDGCTTLPLRFDPSGSMFVVFRSSRLAPRDAGTTNVLSRSERTTLPGPWQVTFDPKWGGPAKPVTFEKLEDWSKHTNPRIRYYSGTAVYRTTFQSRIQTPKSKMFLDLGKVAIMADVTLNGKPLGILWKPPFRLDVTDELKPGENTLELRVVNLWINRMIGDEQLPEDSDRNPSGNLKSWPAWLAEGKPSPTGRYTFSSWRLWKKDDPLIESGLLGPVTLTGDKP